jgi:hypothetical protein
MIMALLVNVFPQFVDLELEHANEVVAAGAITGIAATT